MGATRATGRSTVSLRSSDARSGLRNRRLRDARRGLGIAHFLLRDRARPGEALPAPLIALRFFEICLRPDQIGPRSRLVGFPHGFLARAARVVFAPLTRLPSCSAASRLGLTPRAAPVETGRASGRERGGQVG